MFQAVLIATASGLFSFVTTLGNIMVIIFKETVQVHTVLKIIWISAYITSMLLMERMQQYFSGFWTRFLTKARHIHILRSTHNILGFDEFLGQCTFYKNINNKPYGNIMLNYFKDRQYRHPISTVQAYTVYTNPHDNNFVTN